MNRKGDIIDKLGGLLVRNHENDWYEIQECHNIVFDDQENNGQRGAVDLLVNHHGICKTDVMARKG
jgi:hypothetical protein